MTFVWFPSRATDGPGTDTPIVIIERLRLRTCAAYSSGMSTTQPSLAVRWDMVNALRETHQLETDASLAAAMGIDQSTVSRVTNGKQQPGPRFMAAMCLALGATLDNLFKVERTAA